MNATYCGDCTISNGKPIYVARGRPGRKHFTTGSKASQFASFSFFLASASGRYGSGPSSTTPRPAGIPPTAPMTTSGPAFASWGWISHSAVFMACQIPLKFGLPSVVRGALYVGSEAAAGGGAGACWANGDV